MKYKVYTDGSCVTSSKLGGYGVVVLDEKETIEDIIKNLKSSN